MRPTGARQGGYFFFNLETGRLISCNHWTECVMPREVVDRVHQLARRDDIAGIEFHDRSGWHLQNVSDDESSETSEESDHDYSTGDDSESDNDDHHTLRATHNTSQGQPNGADPEDAGVPATSQQPNDTEGPDQTAEQPGAGEQTLETRYGPRSSTYNLRTRRAPRYDFNTLLMTGDLKAIRRAAKEQARRSDSVIAPRFDVDALSNSCATVKCANEVALTQYGMNEGIKRFGEKGTEAVRRELQQIHDRHVLVPRQPKGLNRDERRRALEYLMFLKKKQDGTVKGGGCADGRKQRHTIDKDSASSPTISTEGLLLIATIAAREKRKVDTVDVPGAYLQTDLSDETVIVKFEGKMAELLEMIDPKMYRSHVKIERGKKVLYAELAKVLYGILRGALLFWEKVSAQLVQWGVRDKPLRLVRGK